MSSQPSPSVIPVTLGLAFAWPNLRRPRQPGTATAIFRGAAYTHARDVHVRCPRTGGAPVDDDRRVAGWDDWRRGRAGGRRRPGETRRRAGPPGRATEDDAADPPVRG